MGAWGQAWGDSGTAGETIARKEACFKLVDATISFELTPKTISFSAKEAVQFKVSAVQQNIILGPARSPFGV